ncbi:MAG: D-alanyl-D-alanine carboxypeptidase [Desulfobacter sp.]|nr:MAG: D-alanyl-D-alanine carboxypeptidase [Desulfobacter sp.]
MTLSCCSNRVFQLIIFLLLLCAPGISEGRQAGYLLADAQGKILYAENEDQLFIPASITKILTSLAALETLGRDYRFETWIGYAPEMRNLYIKGFGDPLLISEQIQKMAHELVRQNGFRTLNNIILDHSFFSQNIVIPGTGESNNPYDATTGALCANFNTLYFKWDKSQKTYVSAEPQTPLPSIFQAEIGKSGLNQGRILLALPHRRLYPGLLAKTFLKNEGVMVRGEINEGTFPPKDVVRLNFKSGFTLAEAVEKLLRFSNNFMANQIMLSMGAIQCGAPATLEKGVDHLNSFSKNRLGLKGYKLAEGSGLSRRNRFTPRQMLKILMAFMPYHRLMRTQGNEFYKTGTLSDVKTRAGYFRGKDERLYPFVIMVNHSNKGYSSIRRLLKEKVATLSSAT